MEHHSVVAAIEANSPDATILLPGGITFPAHSRVLRWACSCAANSPEPLSTWDLTSLVVDGRGPPQTVALWLQLVYSKHLRIYVYYRNAIPYKLQFVCDCLLFADAIGTAPALMEDLVFSRHGCGADLRLDGFWTNGDGEEVTLDMSGRHDYFFHDTYALYSMDTSGGFNWQWAAAWPNDPNEDFGRRMVERLQPIIALARRLTQAKLESTLLRFLQRHMPSGLATILHEQPRAGLYNLHTGNCSSLITPSTAARLQLT
jgi:hypothetical protein